MLDSSIFHSPGELGRSAQRLLWKQENRKLDTPLALLAPPKARDGLGLVPLRAPRKLELSIPTPLDLQASCAGKSQSRPAERRILGQTEDFLWQRQYTQRRSDGRYRGSLQRTRVEGTQLGAGRSWSPPKIKRHAVWLSSRATDYHRHHAHPPRIKIFSSCSLVESLRARTTKEQAPAHWRLRWNPRSLGWWY